MNSRRSHRQMNIHIATQDTLFFLPCSYAADGFHLHCFPLLLQLCSELLLL